MKMVSIHLEFQKRREKNIDLLLISYGEKQHYTVIKSLSRLLSSQVTNHDGSVEFSRRCLNHFPNKKKLSIHEEYCWNYEAIKIEMPEEKLLSLSKIIIVLLKFLLSFMLISKHLQKIFFHANQMMIGSQGAYVIKKISVGCLW